MTRVLPVIFLLTFAPMSAAVEEPADKSLYREQLKLLTVPASKLPAGCSLIAKVKTASIIGAESNPSVFQRAEAIQGVAVIGFSLGDGKKKVPLGIDAAIVVMYQDQKPENEIGVYALVCKNEQTATELLQQVPERLRADVFRKGALLIRVWKDDGASQAACEAVRDYVRKQEFK
jgi:hypothetical protein